MHKINLIQKMFIHKTKILIEINFSQNTIQKILIFRSINNLPIQFIIWGRLIKCKKM